MTIDSFLQPKSRKVSDDQEHHDALAESSASIRQDDPDLDTRIVMMIMKLIMKIVQKMGVTLL